MNRLTALVAIPAAILLLSWATAPVAGEIAGLLFGGLADGLRGALWAIGAGVGVGLALALPLWVVTRRPTRPATYTALPRPVSWWEGPYLEQGATIEAEFSEVEGE